MWGLPLDEDSILKRLDALREVSQGTELEPKLEALPADLGKRIGGKQRSLDRELEKLQTVGEKSEEETAPKAVDERWRQ